MNDRIFGGDIFADVEIYFTDKYLLLNFYSGRMLKKSFYGFFNYDPGFGLHGFVRTSQNALLFSTAIWQTVPDSFKRLHEGEGLYNNDAAGVPEFKTKILKNLKILLD